MYSSEAVTSLRLAKISLPGNRRLKQNTYLASRIPPPLANLERKPNPPLSPMRPFKVQSPPAPSAVSQVILQAGAESETDALPFEILHNLQYQHGWKDLRLHSVSNHSLTPTVVDLGSSIALNSNIYRPHGRDALIYLISGMPPCHSYIHPDFQAHLLKHNIEESAIAAQREWVLPMSLGEKWTLKQFCRVFDALPPRQRMKAEDDMDLLLDWTDTKRVLMGMLATNGMGGDGTVVYYIMQEGEVKPRQNG